MCTAASLAQNIGVRIFASQDLAARIERAECGLLAGGVAAAQARDPHGGFVAEPIAGGVATWCGADSPLNKVAGLGFAGPLDPDAWEAIEDAFDERAAIVRVEVSTLADPSIAEYLTRQGYALIGFENVLGIPLPATLARTSWPDIAIDPVRDDEAAAWLDVVVDGFAAPDDQGVPSHESYPRDVMAAAITDVTAGAGVVRYLARYDGHVAGGASLRMDGGVAQLTGAATLPAYRRRGIQTALFTRRLHDAASAGCNIAVVTTQPGSKSQQNAQRQGFDLLYTRAILVAD